MLSLPPLLRHSPFPFGYTYVFIWILSSLVSATSWIPHILKYSFSYFIASRKDFGIGTCRDFSKPNYPIELASVEVLKKVIELIFDSRLALNRKLWHKREGGGKKKFPMKDKMDVIS